MPEVHKLYGGSSAKYWLNCAAWASLMKRAPKLPPGKYADEGTLAHKFCELRLTGQPAQATMFTSDMIRFGEKYVAFCRDISREGEVEVVCDIPGTAAEGQVGGTADYLAYDPSEKTLYVVDYKYGKQSVEAEDNEQLKLYALGAFFATTYDVERVALIIYQPRALDNYSDGDEIRRFTFDAEDLLDFYGRVLDAVDKSEAEKPEATVGDHCQWCKAKAICPAYETVTTKPLSIFYDGQELPAPDTLDGQRLADALKLRDALAAWFSAIDAYVSDLLLSGEGTVPGFKVVEKIGRRKIVAADEEVAMFALAFGLGDDDVTPRKLTTLTELEKLLKAGGASKADMDEFHLNYTVKESSGLTVAPDSDKRPAVSPIAPDADVLQIDADSLPTA